MYQCVQHFNVAPGNGGDYINDLTHCCDVQTIYSNLFIIY